ncbi:disulfide bond formation protein [Prauserella marina]|uniref:Protein-disulfide isomerase n=1 Tax=Prauserella marina TaxID=530584 RepID=A0A222VPB9_9PSEU|nr:thioredoxin domain-containing protein [Prauserella marina]ASR35750.1 disulfide bond formation protein [Prauserella marina]PWV84361.1 protein-disulfide isomerase [Prauserella marina]SDC24492.1 Protein-disulfide isomerase [Prauserella marina]
MTARTRRDTSKRDGILVGALVLAALGLILYLTIGRSDDSTAAETPRSGPEVPNAEASAHPLAGLARREPGDPMALGAETAPVIMIMYEDYRCPFCAKFTRDIAPELVERYVERGVLRMEWRDLPIFGEQSLIAARAGHAAAEQGRFWEFVDAVHAAAPDRGHPDLTPEALREFAAEAGVADLDRFSSGLDSTRYDSAIQADVEEGTGIGASSVPTFVINGQPILGAQPLDTFVSVIDATTP